MSSLRSRSGGKMNGKHRQSIVEIFAESSFLNGCARLLIRCGNDANVEFEFLLAAQPSDLSVLQDAQKFGLELQQAFRRFHRGTACRRWRVRNIPAACRWRR